MNYSKIRQSDLISLVRSTSVGDHYFQGKRIKEVYCSDGMWYRYADRLKDDENNFRTLLEAVKAYPKFF